jgi:peptidoglycan/xylan/chitin deacetylase (PgdA/CDA1 family)
VKAAVYDAIPNDRLMVRGPASARSRRQIALTFDDGPDDRTVSYLDCLDDLGVRATFFIMGDNSLRRPQLVSEYVRRGHQIGGHGYNHDSFTNLRPRALIGQIEKTSAAIGPQPTSRFWVRPPYGDMDAIVLGRLIAHGTMIALWSFDSFDYKIHDPDELVRRCTPENIEPGDVLLFHENQPWTLAALPRIVENLRGAGYSFATMAEMIGE